MEKIAEMTILKNLGQSVFNTNDDVAPLKVIYTRTQPSFDPYKQASPITSILFA